MSIEKVRDYFKELGIEDRIIEFSVSSATVALAAEALGCKPEYIAKSLTFKSEDSAIMVVAAGDARVDNRKFKETFGIKAKMLTADEAVTLIGHAVGGVCPFAVNCGIKIYLDESLRRFDYVYPACGSSNSAIKLSLDELISFSKADGWCDVCKLPE